MPRPFKARSITQKPLHTRFHSPTHANQRDVVLSLDEYEVLRNCDYLRLSQENCATKMNISRTTVQRIYASARVKMATFLVEGRGLAIEGGPIQVRPIEVNPFLEHRNEKGESIMKIAIGLQGENVAGHFGQCDDFRIYDVVENKIVSTQDIHDDVNVHQLRPPFLKSLGVDVLIMNSLGKGAYNRLLALGIQCVDAQNKSVQEAIEGYLNQTLTTPLVGHECHGCHSHEHKHGETHVG